MRLFDASRQADRNARMALTGYALIAVLAAFCVVGTLVTTCDAAILPAAALADSPVYFGGIVPANGRFGKKIHHFPNTRDNRQYPHPAAVVGSELYRAERDRADDA
ncbi:uncharacterized protein LOC118504196 [Anopheles stephensi]|uniref:uncharacterized protein LOC118504196 n=1 Tax=Anopheles stephensi TaxID=30069 RepID=UPI001658904C|nr:uncharacterized protein LOC118504196 [Anopheles stephensi]